MLWFTAILVASLFIARPAYAERCYPLNGSIDVKLVTEGCESPVGLCTKGRITREPLLPGATTRYTTRAAGATPEDPAGEVAMSYTGRLVITAQGGTVTVDDLGVLDKGTGTIISQSRSLTGTGAYRNVSGSLITYGQASDSGFASRLAGKLCFR